MKKYVDKDALQDFATKLHTKQKTIFATKGEVGTPLVASLVADMTDETKIYVYVGSESGYTAGNWYYYDGSAWTSGGVYNSAAVQTDTTLSVSGMAADAKATGDAISAIEGDLIEIDATLTQSGEAADAKAVGDAIDALKFGENLADTSSIAANNNTAITNNNDGTFTAGTGDYGETILGTQITLAPGRYLLFGIDASNSYSFLKESSSLGAQGKIVQNNLSTDKEITITESTNCYLGFYLGARPSVPLTITPYIKTLGLQQIIDEVTEEVDELSDNVDEIGSSIDTLNNTLYGIDQTDASVILSNDNTAVTNNGDGTYNVGTTDYGTTVFGQQITLEKGLYSINGVDDGYMCLSTSNSPIDRFVENHSSEPLVFSIGEQTDCYLIFRVDTSPASAFILTPFIRASGTEVIADYANFAIESIPYDETLTSYLNSGYHIVTNVNVGSIINITPIYNPGFISGIFPCKSGDTFYITGVGGTSPLLWCFTDENFVKVNGSSESLEASNLPITAQKNGYLIINTTSGYNYALTAKRITDANKTQSDINELFDKAKIKTTRRITNPHELFWRMGTFSASGPQSGIFTDRMFTTCHVKAGSVVAAFSTGGVNISVGYWVDGSTSETMDYFNSYSYQAIGITQDCQLYIGVLYNTPVFLPNDSLLDNVYFNLIVDDYTCKYSKKDTAAFGNPIEVYYEGQHTDETGWTNATDDVDSIHNAFDALVTAGDGYISKTDLGVAYDTYHMYQYDTYPVPANYGGLKVPKIAIICCEHGNEKMSAYAVHYLLHDLINKASKNPALAYLRSNCKLSVIPIANPWGFINKSRFNENGVNLNRNFPTYNWDEYDDETSVIGGINYKGTAPASETQTKMIMAFLRKNYDSVFAIDLHTNGENTSAPYEISATIIPLDPDNKSDAYAVQESYITPSKVNTNRIKPWLDETYDANIGSHFYGAVTVEPDRPTTAQWIRESNNMVGFTYEVLCGSSSGYLGSELTKYSPSAIKAAAEELGNFLVAMLINCKNV